MRGGCNYGNGFGMVIGKVTVVCCECSGITVNMQEQKEITETELGHFVVLGVVWSARHVFDFLRSVLYPSPTLTLTLILLMWRIG
jgi:hypothetical protein